MESKVFHTLWLVVLIMTLGSNPSHATENSEPASPTEVQSSDQDDAAQDNVPPDVPPEDKPTGEKRALSGSILGKGFLGGKRSSATIDDDAKLKRYGFILGNGFSAGKRIPDLSADVNVDTLDDVDDVGYVKRWLGDVYGGGYNIYKRARRDLPDKRYIQYFGNVLGRGFTVGKRDDTGTSEDNDDLQEDVIIPDEDLFHMKPIIADEDDDKASDEIDKRYVDSAPGYRFMFGKRLQEEDDDSDDDDKRYFNSDVGGRFMFGKRADDDDGRVDKRYGFILGRGYSFGKRDRDDDVNKRYGYMLGRGFSFGKRNGDETPDKRYGFMLGKGFSFGKRDDDREMDKRYGFMLGRGFAFGKRENDKRYFGHVLGSGFAIGKRAGSDNDGDKMAGIDVDEDVFVVPEGFEPLDKAEKRMGWMMGKGWRADSKGNKRYGLVLGKGLSFGKRSDESGILPLENTYFINDNGHIEVPDKRFVITQGYKLFRQKPKRYGFVLGKGFAFGKRSEQDDMGDSDGDDMKMDKRYGFLLGRGFSIGKRATSHREFGSILGHGMTLGKRSAEKVDE